MRIGLVGAGLMGHGMALNLLGAGHELMVIAHRNRVPIDDLVSRGAWEAGSFDELSQGAELILLCLSNTEAVRSVINKIVPNLKPGMMIIDTTTNEPTATQELAAQLVDLGVYYIEAPVTGGVKQAKEGVLGAVVGCDEAVLDRAQEILGCFCKKVERFGPVGMGIRAKLVSNFLALGTATLVVETFKHARHLGVDWHKLYELAQLGSGNSSGLQRIVGNALEGDYQGYVFSIENTVKDLSCFCQLIKDNGDESTFAPMMRSIYEQAVADGNGGRFLSELLDPALENTAS